MDWIELIGYAGTTLTIVAYAMKSSIRLRIAAVLSSVAFLTYGALTQSYPVMLMEAILMPLNLWRLVQMLRLVRAASPSKQDSGGLNWLLPHMLRVQQHSGSTIFSDGDRADRLIVIVNGTVCWRGQQLGPGDILGDGDLFATDRRQAGDALAQTDVEIAVTSKSRLVEAYFEDPGFGCRLVQLLLAGMSREIEQIRPAIAKPIAS